jgi:beta-N-acetylhexosaminidase
VSAAALILSGMGAVRTPCWRPLAAAVATALAAGSCGGGAGSGHARSSHPRAQIAAPSPTPDLVDVVYGRLTVEQRVGQLLMVGLSSSDPGPATLAPAIGDQHVGGVVLDGSGWSSAQMVRSAAGALQEMATQAATGGVRLYVAGNQEGGQHGSLQAFYGPGFQDIPAALDQGALPPATLQERAQAWGQELVGAGLNLDLAPVLDTVPPGTDAANQPIGVLRRQLGGDPATVASHGAAFVRGIEAAGESVAEKHFPGLGRVTGNTDFTATGVTDQTTGSADPYLQPYQAGWQAGAQMVMVALASYPRIDPANAAVFSPALITRLLRGQLGFGGVVISDDLGAAAAVQAVAPGDRATRFLRAGGDVVLTVRPSDVAPMTAAVLALTQQDPAFATQVAASVHRVLRAKLQAGLLPAR